MAHSKKDTVVDLQGVISNGQPLAVVTLCYPPVELLEVGQGGSSHPHQEVLVQEAVVGCVRGVQLIHRSGPVDGLHCTYRVHIKRPLL